ncbi:MAG: TIM barrel protein [Ignavibacteriae bacterium]|nr:D-mannonate dehydratase [Ignavibacteriota bacterium]NOG97731.1 TIM barrel protein [Ignavibacteriota bacterium]
MKLGLGLYKSVLTKENFKFAKQAGATHLVIQLVDYIQTGENPSLTNNYLDGWGFTGNENKPWTFEYLSSLKKEIETYGLVIEAIENIDPSHWYDILLDGPQKKIQIENLKNTLQIMGKVGIPILGYNFSIPGVWGWTGKYSGRGGAKSIEFDLDLIDAEKPIPKGMVWNMQYDKDPEEGFLEPVSRKEMWDRLTYFLKELLPVAEENNVKLIAHPDDPPLETMRGIAKLFYSPEEYEKLITKFNSPSNGFEFCMGTIQEMPGSDIYNMLDRYSKLNKIGYVHSRNVIGKVPNYREAFIDEGDIDIIKALKILKKNNFEGVIIPDHTPEMTCGAPWHAGMAYAMGYLKAVLKLIEK